jgi:signal transduction histidine kinase
LHELHQPLVAIRLFADNGRAICKEKPTPDKLRALFEGVGESADLTIRTIGRLRSFLSGKTPTLEPTDVNQAIQEIVRLAEIVARSRGIEIVETLEPGLDCVWADRGALQETFLNLLYNAIEAIDHEGERRVSICTRSAGDAIEIEVADTGCGIPEELRGKLFETAFTTKPQGSGLGLGIARDIVRQHGGSISLRHSNPDVGTSFCVRLPLNHRPHDSANIEALSRPAETRPFERRGRAHADGAAANRYVAEVAQNSVQHNRPMRALNKPAPLA